MIVSSLQIYLLSLVLYIVCLFFVKKLGFIRYQLFVATIYLFSLSFIQTLDITLVIFSFFSMLPYLKSLKLPRNPVFIVFVVYLFVDLLVSIFMNGVINASSIFVIRLIGILLYFLLFRNVCVGTTITSKQLCFTLFLFAACETIISFLAIFISGGFGRLMLNSQCTSGCISIAGILLVGKYLEVCNSKRKIIGFSFCAYFTFWSIASETRGYLVICIFMTLVYILLYCSTQTKTMIVLGLIVIFVIFGSNLSEYFLKITRFDASTGRRGAENQFVLEYMFQSPIHLIFGYGFGQRVGLLNDVGDLISTVSSGDVYVNYILYQVSGFHNFFATIFYSCGLVGLSIVFIAFIYLLFSFVMNYSLKQAIVLCAYFASYLFLLWFRWSATSGILEFAVLSYVAASYKIQNCDQKNHIPKNQLNHSLWMPR